MLSDYIFEGLPLTERVMQGEEITFVGNRWSSITTLALSVAVGALGAWVALFDHALFGIVIVIAAVVPAALSLPIVFSPKSRYLRLDPSGFEVVGLRRRRERVKWDDVAEFRWGVYNDAPVIEIEYKPEYAQRNGLAGEQPFTGRILDRYNAPLNDVLEALIEWRTRYVQRAQH
jgi:hypothetical protein